MTPAAPSTPYRTLVFAELVQESALNAGGNRPHSLVDLPLARDGQGRPVLRGSTLAGCFIAAARALSGQVPHAISAGGIAQQRLRTSSDTPDLLPSAWRFANAHPLTGASAAFYQHVSIHRATQAALDGALYNLEALPPGTRWSFELEIAPSAGRGPEATPFATLEALAAAVLAQWQQRGGARLGRGSRHGYGWCHLENLHIVRLDASQQSLWPDAFAPARTPAEWVQHLRQQGLQVLSLEDWRALLDASATLAPPASPRCELLLSGHLHVGERADAFGTGYGLDTLSVGGHAQSRLHARDLHPQLMPPAPATPDAATPAAPASPKPNTTQTSATQPSSTHPSADAFDPDFVIACVRHADGNLRPHLSGASLRGIWRSALERHCRALGADPADPDSIVATLFGSTERAGALSVADARLCDDTPWELLWQQHVAIDELSGGAYGSAKYDRLCLARATFGWQARISAASQAEAQRLAAPLRELLQALGDGHLPLGGGVWRGHGHIRWTLDPSPASPSALASTTQEAAKLAPTPASTATEAQP